MRRGCQRCNAKRWDIRLGYRFQRVQRKEKCEVQLTNTPLVTLYSNLWIAEIAMLQATAVLRSARKTGAPWTKMNLHFLIVLHPI